MSNGTPLPLRDDPAQGHPIWRHMQTAKCLGSNMGGCPIQGKTDYDVIRVGYVDSLHARIRDQQRYIGHLEAALASTKHDARRAYAGISRSYFRDRFIEPEIVEPVHDYGSQEMSREEAWKLHETPVGPHGTIGPAQRFDFVDGVWWRLL